MSKQCTVIDPGEGCSSVELDLLAMQLVRSLYKANFDLYVQCLGQFMPWLSMCRGCLPLTTCNLCQMASNSYQRYDSA